MLKCYGLETLSWKEWKSSLGIITFLLLYIHILKCNIAPMHVPHHTIDYRLYEIIIFRELVMSCPWVHVHEYVYQPLCLNTPTKIGYISLNLRRRIILKCHQQYKMLSNTNTFYITYNFSVKFSSYFYATFLPIK